MTEYGHFIGKHQTITPLFSHDSVKEKREARKKLLAAVEQRRAENSRRYYTEIQTQASTRSLHEGVLTDF